MLSPLHRTHKAGHARNANAGQIPTMEYLPRTKLRDASNADFLVAVSLWLVRASHIEAEVLSLWLRQLGEVYTQCVKVQASNHFVKVLW